MKPSVWLGLRLRTVQATVTKKIKSVITDKESLYAAKTYLGFVSLLPMTKVAVT
jgi:hypothetical protein